MDDAVMQILGLQITDDIELIQKALLANNNRVDDSITWLFNAKANASVAQNNEKAAPKNILNQKEEIKPVETVKVKTLDERKIELEKKARERQLQKEAEEKEREFQLMKMQEEYEAYQMEKEEKAEETRRRVEELKRVKALRELQLQKQKKKERMQWHAKQAKYAEKENELNNYVLQALERKEKDLNTPVQAINKVLSLGNFQVANQSFTLVSKILTKILNSNEAKFRTINRQKTKKVELLIVEPTGIERLLILLGFQRTHAELKLPENFDPSKLKDAIQELKTTMEFMTAVQSVIRKNELVQWHCAVSLVLDSLVNGSSLPSFDMCTTLFGAMKPYITESDRKQTAVQILKFHETQLWLRHPLVPLFRELKHKVVDAEYLKRIVKLSSTILGSDRERINVKKLGKKISNMTEALWRQFFEICGYVPDEEEYMKRSSEVNPILFSFLSGYIPKSSSSLIPA